MSERMFGLDGRTALVTGAATGIGAAIAVALARQGAAVAVTDRPGVSLERTRGEIHALGGRSVGGAIDVRETAQIEAGVRAVATELGRVDILVNNAGINRPAPGLEVTPESWDEHFAVNVRGGFFMAQAVARGMIERGWGRIVFIASQSGLVGFPGQPAYCASKGAVVQLVRSLGVEWASNGVTVNCVAPTFVETDLTRKRLEEPGFRSFVLGRIPAGTLAQPSNVAAAVVYLASEEARMVTGTALSVDGGWTAW